MRRALGRAPRAAPAALAIFVFMVVLEISPRLAILPPESFPPTSSVLVELVNVLDERSFWKDLGDTMSAWAGGLGVALVAAIPLGLVIGRNEVLYHSLRFPIEFLRPVPSVALVPLAVILLGIGVEMKIFLAAFACFWILLFQTIYGARATEPVAMDTARVFGLNRYQTLWHVVLPSAAPYIATGVRIAASVALILAITAEIVVGSPGIGQTIVTARSGRAIELMYALILVTGLVGIMINKIVYVVEARTLAWHPSHRPEVETT